MNFDVESLHLRQQQVARLVGITARRLRDLQKRGDVPGPNSSLGDQVRGYTAFLRRAEQTARRR